MTDTDVGEAEISIPFLNIADALARVVGPALWVQHPSWDIKTFTGSWSSADKTTRKESFTRYIQSIDKKYFFSGRVFKGGEQVPLEVLQDAMTGYQKLKANFSELDLPLAIEGSPCVALLDLIDYVQNPPRAASGNPPVTANEQLEKLRAYLNRRVQTIQAGIPDTTVTIVKPEYFSQGMTGRSVEPSLLSKALTKRFGLPNIGAHVLITREFLSTAVQPGSSLENLPDAYSSEFSLPSLTGNPNLQRAYATVVIASYMAGRPGAWWEIQKKFISGTVGGVTTGGLNEMVKTILKGSRSIDVKQIWSSVANSMFQEGYLFTETRASPAKSSLGSLQAQITRVLIDKIAKPGLQCTPGRNVLNGEFHPPQPINLLDEHGRLGQTEEAVNSALQTMAGNLHASNEEYEACVSLVKNSNSVKQAIKKIYDSIATNRKTTDATYNDNFRTSIKNLFSQNPTSIRSVFSTLGKTSKTLIVKELLEQMAVFGKFIPDRSTSGDSQVSYNEMFESIEGFVGAETHSEKNKLKEVLKKAALVGVKDFIGLTQDQIDRAKTDTQIQQLLENTKAARKALRGQSRQAMRESTQNDDFDYEFLDELQQIPSSAAQAERASIAKTNTKKMLGHLRARVIARGRVRRLRPPPRPTP